MFEKIIAINLFGACTVRSVETGRFEITGSKHKALFVLLATAPFGRRTRSFLQEALWGTACFDTGRQSLRRALSDIKQLMGSDFGAVLTSTNTEVTLDLSRIDFIGRPGNGTFLEGLDLRERYFTQWLTGIRENPAQVYALYSLSSQAPALPILPVVAILPFRAAPGAQEHAVLGDWLAEELSRSLSRSRMVAVISHLSCRELSRQIVDIPSVRARLQANYCVVGSLRTSGNDLVLDADFIDTRSGRILWTRQFSAAAARFLARATDGIEMIVRTIGRAIADEAVAHVNSTPLEDIEDHKLLIAGVEFMHRPTLSAFARSRQVIEEAISRAPATAEAHAWLGKWYVLSVFNSWSTNTAEDTRKAIDCTARALDLSPENSFCLTIDGFAQNNLLRRLDIADKRYSSALAINPNEALSWLLKGAMCAFRDDSREAVRAVTTARKLSPLDPFGYFYDTLSATAFFAAGDHEKALVLAERSLGVNDRHLSTLRTKIAALHSLGRHDDARTTAGELMRRQPDFTVSEYMHQHPAAEFKVGRQVAEALVAAGVP
jgi:TolB-like protein